MLWNIRGGSPSFDITLFFVLAVTRVCVQHGRGERWFECSSTVLEVYYHLRTVSLQALLMTMAWGMKVRLTRALCEELTEDVLRGTVPPPPPALLRLCVGLLSLFSLFACYKRLVSQKRCSKENMREKVCTVRITLQLFVVSKYSWLHCRECLVCFLLYWGEYLNLIHCLFRVWLLSLKFGHLRFLFFFFFLRLKYKVRGKKWLRLFLICILFFRMLSLVTIRWFSPPKRVVKSLVTLMGSAAPCLPSLVCLRKR